MERRLEQAEFRAKVAEQNLNRRLDYVKRNYKSIFYHKVKNTVAPPGSIMDKTTHSLGLAVNKAKNMASSVVHMAKNMLPSSNSKAEKPLAKPLELPKPAPSPEVPLRPVGSKRLHGDEARQHEAKVVHDLYQLAKPLLIAGALAIVKKQLFRRLFGARKKGK